MMVTHHQFQEIWSGALQSGFRAFITFEKRPTLGTEFELQEAEIELELMKFSLEKVPYLASVSLKFLADFF